MDSLGLRSISFREQTPEMLVAAVKAAGLDCIEWGSDVHAPCEAEDRLRQLAALQKDAGIACSSYGTYFRLGRDNLSQLRHYIRAAQLLGTDVLRLWCGEKDASEYSARELERLYSQCRTAAALAEAEGVMLCMECHGETLTSRKESALDLMLAVSSPAFRMYWQPNQLSTEEENLSYAWLLSPYIHHVHVVNWCRIGSGVERRPLEEAIPLWREYLKRLPGERTLLLEFMPDDQLSSLPREAAALKKIASKEILK